MLIQTWLSFPALLSMSKITNYWTGRIASDERVVFFPTAANQINATHWNVPIHGWIFQPEAESRKRKAIVRLVGNVFHVKSEEEKRFLKQRLMPFAVDNQSMKFVNIQIGNELHRLSNRSAKDGHFFDNLILTEQEMQPKDGIVTFQAKDDKDRIFPGEIHLIPSKGISIISDIDDTIKITNYLDKKEFYKNTFIRKFVAVPGMAELYSKFKVKYENCCFHFVSASPYQLFEDLNKFTQEAGFPPATFYLKRIRVKDKSLLQLLADPQDYKIQHIEPLLKLFPERKFVMVGDSGEKDPEIYTQLFQKYPDQIEKVWIRNVNNASADRMDGIDADKWEYFSEGSDLLP